MSEWRCGGVGWTRHLGALALALILGLGLFFAWALPANRASGGALAAAGLGHHVVARSLRPLEGHGGSLVLYLPFYPLVLLIGMLPWSAYLPAGLAALWRGQVLDAGRRRLLWGWILPLTALMTLVATKLPHYVLPVVPALALVAALALHARAVGSSSLERWWDLGRWWLRLSGSLVAALLILGPWLQPLVAPRRFLVGMGLLVGAAVWQGTRLMGRRQQRPALALLALSGVLVAGQVRVLLPVVETAKPAPRLARAVRQATAAELPVWAAGFREPSLAFYLGRGFVELGRDEVAPWLASGREGVLITEAGLLPASLDPELELLARARGFNVAKGEWVDVVAVLRASGTP